MILLSFKYLTNIPLRFKLLIFFLPIIILSVFLTGFLSYQFAVSQFEKNAYSLLSDTVKQTNIYLDDKLSTMFEQLLAIENDPAFNKFVLDDNGTQTEADKYSSFITLNDKFNDVNLKYYQMLDSIYLYTNTGKELKLLRDSIPVHIGLDIEQWVKKYHGSKNGYYWLNQHEDDVLSTVDKRQVLSVFKIIGNESSKVKSILLFNLRSNYFLKVIQNVNVSTNGYIIMVSADGTMSSKEQDEKYAISPAGIEFLRENMGNSGSFNIKKAMVKHYSSYSTP